MQNQAQPATRDLRLDAIRGIALMMIFINHVPGNILEALTSRNFGFSDAAEAFVLISGIAVGLAYSRYFSGGLNLDAVMRVWKRASTLYTTHIVTTVWAIAIVAAGIHFLDTVSMANSVNFSRLLDRPLAAMIGVPLMTHQLGYFNILPLYLVLLFISPIYIMIGLRNPVKLIAFAAIIWMIAGLFRLNFPNYPNEGGWFFNPLSWQLVFAIGIAGGMAAKNGQKLVQPDQRLFIAAGAYLLLSLVWVVFKLGALPMAKYVPFFIGSFDKTFLSLPRLLHVLALAYVVTNITMLRGFFTRPICKPLVVMGQQGLSVFVTGSLLAISFQVLKRAFETNVFEDIALLSTGILIQYAVASFFAMLKENSARAANARAQAVAKRAEAGRVPATLPRGGSLKASEAWNQGR